MGRAEQLIPEQPTPGNSTASTAASAARRRILILLAVSLVCIVVGGYWLREAVGPLVLAVGLAYVLDPIVALLMRRARMSRGLAVFVVFFVFLAAAGAALW
ncbi:MAG TPA: hypothetical protein PKE00_16910, partial [Planctomycetota bacterium]|nr:hypothetical protein [Planctomycetota bacterium]